MEENVINAIAELIRNVSWLVVIFGFISFALKTIYDAVSGGRIR